MERDYLREAMVFKAFCDEKRLRILELLQNDERCVCALNEELNMPQSTLSYHMKILCESGIVEGRQQGKWTHYCVRDEGVQDAMNILKSFSFKAAKRQRSKECCH